jgi:hypothetical protein
MFALRTAAVITGAATLANPAGSPLVARGRPGTGVVQRGPRVGGLHGKRPPGGAYDQPFARYQLDDLAGLGQPPAEEVGDEIDPPDGDRRGTWEGGRELHVR